MELAGNLEDQGTPPDVSRELAMAQLLPKPPDEEDVPEEWERDGAAQDLTDAAERFLTGS
jgi:hypothetical protein